MRTKVLLLTAALGVAMVANSMAQVYSANAVGYVNMTLQPGLNLIANPLNASPDNDVNNILQLDAAAVGATIYRWDTSIQNYGEAIQWIGSGWITFDTDPNWRVLDPGVAFFIRVPSAQEVTFVGEVPQGALANPIEGSGGLSFVSSQVPQEARLGHIPDLTGPDPVGLEFPAATGDTVFTWTGTAWSTWQYQDGIGWLNFDTPNAEGPLVAVGTGFAVRKNGPAANWNRDFSVND